MSYNLYLGRIVGTVNDTYGDRLQVKITPQMDNINDGECPLFPHFFKDQSLTGTSNELVWVVCNDDFSLGYVLGLANYNTYSEDKETFTQYSIPSTLKDNISTSLEGLKADTFDYSNLKVTYWNENAIHFVEKTTGGMVIAFNTGTFYIFRPNEFIINIKGSSSATARNAIKIDSNGVSILGDKINLQSDDVGLGNNPAGYVNITNGSTAQTSITSTSVRA